MDLLYLLTVSSKTMYVRSRDPNSLSSTLAPRGVRTCVFVCLTESTEFLGLGAANIFLPVWCKVSDAFLKT